MDAAATSRASTDARARYVRWRMALLAGSLLIGTGAAGCTLLQDQQYREKDEIAHLTVILMDEESLRTEWRKVSGKPSSNS